MDKVKAALSYLSAPLEFVAACIGKYPKGALIAWLISLAVAAWLF